MPRREILLYDGECGMCCAVSAWLARKRGGLTLVALQAPEARRWLQERGLDAADLDSVVLLGPERVRIRSDAVLQAVTDIGGPWRIAGWLRVIPGSWRDAVYRWVARNRHRLWPGLPRNS